jgi:hypothetical protein
MAGLVAIIRTSGAPVSADEIGALAHSYESLRGVADRSAAGSDAGRVIVIAAPGSRNAGLVRDRGSWTAHVGRPLRASGTKWTPLTWDGQFAAVSYSADDDEIVVAADPLGMQAVYVAERPGRLLVSSSALALARYARARPSAFAIETFLRMGLQFGSQTHWADVERLEPAALVRVRSGTVERETYWRPAVDPRLERLDIGAAADACIERFDRAAQPYLTDGARSACDITGGWDSRLATLLLRHAGLSFTTNTVGDGNSIDVRLGEQVARAAGWSWSREDLPADWPDRLPDLAGEALAWGDGQLEVTQLAAVRHHHAERADRVDVQFSGGGGEHWRYYGWMSEFPRGGRSTRPHLERLVKYVGYLKPLDITPLRRDPTPDVAQHLVWRLAAYLEPHSQLPRQFQLDLLYGYKSTGHHGAFQSASRDLLAMELPFYLREVFSCSFSVAPAHRNYHRFMRLLMERLDPAVAAVPTTNGGPALPFTLRRAPMFVPYVADHGRRIARQVSKSLPGPTIPAPGPPAEELLQRARRRLLDQWSAGGLRELRAAPLLDRARLLELVQSPRATAASWPILGRIMTVEMALAAADAALE